MESVEEKEASAVDGDAEDNTTTIDCSSEGGGGGPPAQMMLIPGGGGAEGSAAGGKKLPKSDSMMTKSSRRKKDLLERRGRRGRGGPQQRKRRRGGANRNKHSRRSGGGEKRKAVNWQLPEGSSGNPSGRKDVIITPAVPYNTNRFLMEYHMDEVNAAAGPDVGRDEFLTSEFSAVYETAKAERLEGLSKAQLIQEYLQIEANYDKLRQQRVVTGNGSSHSSHNRAKWESHWRSMKDQLRRLAAENHELKSELKRIKGGSVANRPAAGDGNPVDDSVDSESDSSVSSISSRSSSCSRSSGTSSSSSSSSGSCCSSRCSSRDSRGNILPSRRASADDEAMPMVNGENGQPMEVAETAPTAEKGPELNHCTRPHHHRRHRTHRQRRNSRLNHNQQSVGDAAVVAVSVESVVGQGNQEQEANK